MPAFSQIEVFLDGSYSPEERKAAVFKSRSICNYLERALREENSQTTLSRINIFCSKEIGEEKVSRLNEPPFLEVFIKYDLPDFSDLNESSVQMHFIRIIDRGLKTAMNSMPLPYEYCMSALLKFEEEKFKNEWVQVRKSWKKLAVCCDVVAHSTTEKFLLEQLIYRDGCMIKKKKIAETKPREALFHEYFGVLSMDKTGAIVYKNKSKLLSRFSIEANQFYEADLPVKKILNAERTVFPENPADS